MYPMVPLIEGQVSLVANVGKMIFKHPLRLSDKCPREFNSYLYVGPLFSHDLGLLTPPPC